MTECFPEKSCWCWKEQVVKWKALWAVIRTRFCTVYEHTLLLFSLSHLSLLLSLYSLFLPFHFLSLSLFLFTPSSSHSISSPCPSFPLLLFHPIPFPLHVPLSLYSRFLPFHFLSASLFPFTPSSSHSTSSLYPSFPLLPVSLAFLFHFLSILICLFPFPLPLPFLLSITSPCLSFPLLSYVLFPLQCSYPSGKTWDILEFR